jgi:hypothetical protein
VEGAFRGAEVMWSWGRVCSSEWHLGGELSAGGSFEEELEGRWSMQDGFGLDAASERSLWTGEAWWGSEVALRLWMRATVRVSACRVGWGNGLGSVASVELQALMKSVVGLLGAACMDAESEVQSSK